MPEGKRIVHPSLDSEYYSSSVLNYLMKRGVTFCIVADLDRAVRKAIKRIREWRPYRDRDGIKTEREIGETVHVMNKREGAFRLVVLRQKKKQLDLFSDEEYFLRCPHLETPFMSLLL